MDAVTVNVLWNRITEMEQERRFDGDAYPNGMTAFPFRLRGQGFFPGGDGLWREDGNLESPSDGEIRKGGVMFLGNDFGTLGSYNKLRSRGFENPPTWRHLKSRVISSGLPSDVIFATNAVLGLRREGKALDRSDWEAMPKFGDFCREFLQFQVETIQPRLIVVLGPAATTLRSLLSDIPPSVNGTIQSAAIGGHRCFVQFTSHPYADFALDAAQRQRLADELKEAWAAAK